MREKRDLIAGRLLALWYRSGKTVPEGFEGTLRDYALHIALSALEDEVEYITAVDIHPSRLY
jgi:hypothetical protein